MKIVKSRAFQIILTAIIFTGIGAFADNLIDASKIVYTDSNNNERTLDVVLDDLYTGLNNYMKVSRFGTPMVDYSQGNIMQSRTKSLSLNKGKYLVLDSINVAYGQKTAYTNGHTTIAESQLTCENNTKCTATKLFAYWNGIQAGAVLAGDYKIVSSTKNFIYFVEIKENNTTITATLPATTATNTGAQSITLVAIPLND